MDEETKKVLTDAEKIKKTIDTEGWRIIMKILNEILSDNDSILDIGSKNRDDMYIEIASRQLAIGMIKQWIDDVTGITNTYKSYKEIIYQNEEEGIYKVSD